MFHGRVIPRISIILLHNMENHGDYLRNRIKEFVLTPKQFMNIK